MAFVCLGMLELVHCFNIRSEESLLKIGILKNKYLVGAFIIGTILQVGVVLLPEIANIFSVVPLNLKQWLCTIIISILPIFIVEIQKKINEIKFEKIVYEINTKACQKRKHIV